MFHTDEPQGVRGSFSLDSNLFESSEFSVREFPPKIIKASYCLRYIIEKIVLNFLCRYTAVLVDVFG